MNEPTLQRRPSSLYARQREEDCVPYLSYFDGSLDALFCVVSRTPASVDAKNALDAAALRFGVQPSEVGWIVLKDENISASGLLTLTESIDPLCLAVLDEASAKLLSRAYNRPIHLECTDFLLGRPCCCFMDFERMLKSDHHKQVAWALLKDMFSYARVA